MRLSIRGAAIGRDPRRPVQRDLELSVASGEVCCVLGPNGCGKTTLVSTVLGDCPPLAGRFELDGEDMTRWSAARLARSVAYVAQRAAQPFPYLVRDVVMLGRLARMGGRAEPGPADVRACEAAMEQAGVRRLRDEPYTEVSGGELQMVMFARALAQEPQLLVLDEPTAALDYGNAVRVVTKVRELAQDGYGVLMVTHDPDHAFMCRANVALLFRDGPMAFGPAEDVVTRANIRRAYGVDVRLVEFANADGEVMRLCAPEFGTMRGRAGNDGASGEKGRS